MTAALLAAPPAAPCAPRPVTIRPAPRREPPFDDELGSETHTHTAFDRRLPFEQTPRPSVWRPRPPRASGLPDPAPWGRRLLIGMIETAGGHRPLQQLTALLSPSVSRGLCTDFDRARESGGAHWLHRASIRSVRAAEPSEGVAELCATVELGRRVRAIAIRLEAQHGRWRCTRLQLG